MDPEVGMLIVKIGGPAYRIGMGGGAASSIPSGSNKAELDFNAVQARPQLLLHFFNNLSVALDMSNKRSARSILLKLAQV